MIRDTENGNRGDGGGEAMFDEVEAKTAAKIFRGQALNRSGRVWLIVKERPSDGHFVVFSDECICVYDSWRQFVKGIVQKENVIDLI